MTFTQHKSNVRTIRQNDPDFQIVDGFALIPRAMIYITPECPIDYRQLVTICMDKGWIKAVAHVTDQELMWDTLRK
jgi:hypothetical protein